MGGISNTGGNNDSSVYDLGGTIVTFKFTWTGDENELPVRPAAQVVLDGALSGDLKGGTCGAPLASNGSCGPSAGVPASSPPVGGLCSSGFPTSVQGTGPYTWTCVGANGGSNAGCATLASVACDYSTPGKYCAGRCFGGSTSIANFLTIAGGSCASGHATELGGPGVPGCSTCTGGSFCTSGPGFAGWANFQCDP